VALGLAGSLGTASTVGVVAATQAREGRAEPNSSVEVHGPYNTYFSNQFTVDVRMAMTPDEAERVAHAAAENHCTKRTETLVVQREFPIKYHADLFPIASKERKERPFDYYIQFICKAVAQ
jgi:hypothetical protein